MRRAVALILTLLLSLPAMAQSADDAAANRLFVEAVKARVEADARDLDEADIAGWTRKRDLLVQVERNLRDIVDRHAGSGLAVRLILMEDIGGISLLRAAREAAAAREGLAVAQDAVAAAATLKSINDAAGIGRVLRDCPDCPELVVVPAGATRLAAGRDVTIAAPFAVGKFEVTFAEWDACVAAGGCNHRPDDAGWGRGRQPVMNVGWYDAQQYVAWLSRRTGKAYRLLSEAEWEYAAQAGSGLEQSVQHGANQANCDGCGSRWDKRQTAPVGSFAANAFGLHDMLGNVWEWTADCWNESHDGAPADGSARLSGDCSLRVLRGGSWYYVPWDARSALRIRDLIGLRVASYGFRVARTL